MVHPSATPFTSKRRRSLRWYDLPLGRCTYFLRTLLIGSRLSASSHKLLGQMGSDDREIENCRRLGRANRHPGAAAYPARPWLHALRDGLAAAWKTVSPVSLYRSAAQGLKNTAAARKLVRQLAGHEKQEFIDFLQRLIVENNQRKLEHLEPPENEQVYKALLEEQKNLLYETFLRDYKLYLDEDHLEKLKRLTDLPTVQVWFLELVFSAGDLRPHNARQVLHRALDAMVFMESEHCRMEPEEKARFSIEEVFRMRSRAPTGAVSENERAERAAASDSVLRRVAKSLVKNLDFDADYHGQVTVADALRDEIEDLPPRIQWVFKDHSASLNPHELLKQGRAFYYEVHLRSCRRLCAVVAAEPGDYFITPSGVGTVEDTLRRMKKRL